MPASLTNTQLRSHRALLAGLTFAIIGGACWMAWRPVRTAPTVVDAEVLRQNLALRDGRWYRTGQTNPFTGCMADYYPNGARMFRAAVSNGLLNGVSEGWYTNGQVQIRETYKDSVADGLREKWYENGQRKSEAMITQGKLEGPFRSWHENGQLSEKIELVQGQPEGEAWAFYSSGFAKARTEVRAGQVLDQKSWEDGQYQPPGALDSGLRHPKANQAGSTKLASADAN